MLTLFSAFDAYSLGMPRVMQRSSPIMASRDDFAFGGGGGDGVKGVKTVSFQGLSQWATAGPSMPHTDEAFKFGPGGGDGVKGVKTVSFQGTSQWAQTRLSDTAEKASWAKSFTGVVTPTTQALKPKPEPVEAAEPEEVAEEEEVVAA